MKRSWKEKHQPSDQPNTIKASLQYTLIVLCGILVLLVYFWFIKTSPWSGTSELDTNNYYNLLAKGFDSGQLSLPNKVNSALLTLHDPYDFNSRKNIPYLWDVSLYNGKYYLYWGPAPALIVAFIKLIYPGVIGDQIITFAFLVGSLILSILILISLWHDFFTSLPIWAVLISILVAGLVIPIPWLLHRANAYEAAITSGQFFLIGGAYWVYLALTRSPVSKLYLILAGIFWALSFGSRATLAFPIAFLLCLTGIGIVRIYSFNRKEFAQIILTLAAIGVPVVLGIMAYGWYNWARFGSVFEFGLRYQLTKYNLLDNYNLIFSTSYFRTNFHNYILQPFKTIDAFPFIKAPLGTDALISGTSDDTIFKARNIVGLLYSFPFGIFSIFPLITIIMSFLKMKINHYPMNKNGISITSLSIGLAGSVLFGAIPTLLCFRVVMRYIFDFIPSLTLLTILGFWLAYQYSLTKPIARILTSIIALGLAIFSILVSIALTISFY